MESPTAQDSAGSDSALDADILLVDDDAVIRDVTGFTLQLLGYSPIVKGSASAGLEAAMASRNFRLLIADVIMPGMNGVDLAEKVRAICPDVRVLLCSGYPQATLAARGVVVGNHAFLQKPVSLPMFSAKLQELLGPGPNKGGS
jgi:CheY-like chemotaxis protein